MALGALLAGLGLMVGTASGSEHGVSAKNLASLGLANMRILPDSHGMTVRGKAFSYPPTLPSGAAATLPTLPAPNSRLRALPSTAKVPLYPGNPGQPGR